MNMSRQPKSPTKLNNRSKAITYTDDNGTSSLDTLNLPKKTMIQVSTREKKPAWDSSSRPITKDSVRSTPKSRPQTKDSVRSNNSLANKRTSVCDENGSPEKSNNPQKRLKPIRQMSPKEVEEEAFLCATLEKNIGVMKRKLADKTIIFDKLSQEIFRMLGLFERLERMGETRGSELMEAEQAMAQHGLTHQQRKELMEKGPFNLVFHGLKADWIEEEMADDEEFKRDVLEQKIRTLIREECGLLRDVGIIDVYRHMDGAPLRGAFPVVVQFKARREKEQIMWRCKEKLRDSDIVVTEDSQSRLMALMHANAEKIKQDELAKRAPRSPKKERNDGLKPTSKVLVSPSKFPSSPNKTRRSDVQFNYSTSRPTHLNQTTGSLSKSPMKLSNETKNDQVNGNNLIMSKRKTSFNNVPTVKSFFLSETGEEEETEDDEEEIELDEETDVFPGDDEFDDRFDNLLDDFPEVDLPKSPKKEKLELPESPQKALFEDFMF